jgi:hypothetical protein
MNIRLARLAIATGVAAAALTVLVAAPAQALPAGSRNPDCDVVAAAMRDYANWAHEARMKHDYYAWSMYQDLYVVEWYRYQDLGC